MFLKSYLWNTKSTTNSLDAFQYAQSCWYFSRAWSKGCGRVRVPAPTHPPPTPCEVIHVHVYAYVYAVKRVRFLIYIFNIFYSYKFDFARDRWKGNDLRLIMYNIMACRLKSEQGLYESMILDQNKPETHNSA